MDATNIFIAIISTGALFICSAIWHMILRSEFNEYRKEDYPGEYRKIFGLERIHHDATYIREIFRNSHQYDGEYTRLIKNNKKSFIVTAILGLVLAILFLVQIFKY